MKYLSRTDVMDCAFGVDILRERDNLLATILIDSNKFRFFVWHDRFPKDNEPIIRPAARHMPPCYVIGTFFF